MSERLFRVLIAGTLLFLLGSALAMWLLADRLALVVIGVNIGWCFAVFTATCIAPPIGYDKHVTDEACDQNDHSVCGDRCAYGDE